MVKIMLFLKVAGCHLYVVKSHYLFSLDLTLLSLVPEFRNLTFESPQIRLIVNRSSSVLDIRSFDPLFWFKAIVF